MNSHRFYLPCESALVSIHHHHIYDRLTQNLCPAMQRYPFQLLLVDLLRYHQVRWYQFKLFSTAHIRINTQHHFVRVELLFCHCSNNTCFRHPLTFVFNIVVNDIFLASRHRTMPSFANGLMGHCKFLYVGASIVVLF